MFWAASVLRFVVGLRRRCRYVPRIIREALLSRQLPPSPDPGAPEDR
jgi:hypothetical protein